MNKILPEEDSDEAEGSVVKDAKSVKDGKDGATYEI